MSISITRYVDITSGVGAGSVVPTRDLVGRLFTANDLVPQKVLYPLTVPKLSVHISALDRKNISELFFTLVLSVKH